MTALLLVRHARAGSRRDWEGDDRDRPLSGKGRTQAKALVPVVAKLLPKQASNALVLSSPWLRCVQTAQPIAGHLGADVKELAEFGEGMGSDAADLVVGMAEINAVCCTHGDVIEAVLDRMRAQGLDLGPHPVCPKGSIWALQSRHGTFRTARYVAPPA